MRVDRAWMLAFLTILGWMSPASLVRAEYNSFYASGNSGQDVRYASGYVYGSAFSRPAAYHGAFQGAAPMSPMQLDAPMGGGAAPGLMPQAGPAPYGPVDPSQMHDYVTADGQPLGGIGHEPWNEGQCGEGCEAGGCPHILGLFANPTCNPRWFNIHAEAMFLERSTVPREIEFAREGLLGPTALSTRDLDFDHAPGVRFTTRIDVGTASNIEGTYFGAFFWDEAAQATSANDNLYSVFSDFGFDPFGGFLETDQTSLQRIVYDSELHNVELNYRRHWALCPIQGSWVMGLRYASLNERFRYLTQADAHIDPLTALPRGPGELDYRTATTNDLLGFQVGGDIYLSLFKRLSIGTDLKGGLYGNHSQQRTLISATTLGTVIEEADDHNVAFIGEANFIAVYHIAPGLALRGGYQFMVIDGVALAPSNFDPTPPLNNVATRTPSVNHKGDVFYHGATLGLEWLW